MIKEIACSQQSKDALIKCAEDSGLCMLGHGHCGKYKSGVFSDCERCLDERIKWIIVNMSSD